MTQEEILRESLTRAEEEVLRYQIDIDNYIVAINKAINDPETVDVYQYFKSLLEGARTELEVATRNRDAILLQLNSL